MGRADGQRVAGQSACDRALPDRRGSAGSAALPGWLGRHVASLAAAGSTAGPACFASPAALRAFVGDAGNHPLRSCLGWQLHGQSVKAAALDVTAERNLDCVEFFCGVGSIVRAARLAGLQAEGYDKARQAGVANLPASSCEDITTKSGFLNALRLLQRVRHGGLVWFAPMCNSFNWLCRHQSQRALENAWVGDESRSFVATGNQAATACSCLIAVACLRGLTFVLENPPRSLVWRYLAARGADQCWRHTATCDRCAFSTGHTGPGSEITKQYSLFGNMPWVSELGVRCRCPPHIEHVSMTRVVGRKRWGQPSLMRGSAAYPVEMGVAVVQAWMSSWKDRPGSTGFADRPGSTGSADIGTGGIPNRPGSVVPSTLRLARRRSRSRQRMPHPPSLGEWQPLMAEDADADAGSASDASLLSSSASLGGASDKQADSDEALLGE